MSNLIWTCFPTERNPDRDKDNLTHTTVQSANVRQMRVSQDFAVLDTEPNDRSIWTDQLKRTQSPRSYY